MKVMTTLRPRILPGLVLILAAGAAGAAEGYHDRAAVAAALAEWAGEHPTVVELYEIGSSAGGHPLQVLRLAADGDVEAAARPAIFVGANVAGDHNAGTEAALDLVRTLLAAEGETAELLQSRTFYVAPVLNPDAHDAFFTTPRVRRRGNAEKIDRDRDGFVAEDDWNDLDGDGRITWLRIPDPAGQWLPHPEEPRLMIREDASKGYAGAYRLIREGDDDDGDGEHDEDTAEGVVVDHNFPHVFPYTPEAGPWPGSTPEAKALFDFFFAHKEIALAVVYGPANNLLATPESLGGGGDLGSLTFKVPSFIAEYMGLDPEVEYTLDEIWETAKDLPMVRQRNVTKEQLGQFLGAGPATQVEDDDQKVLQRWAKDYKKRLEDAGLDKDGDDRARLRRDDGKQYAKGGFTPWLYYQFGAMAIELDVWGVPKPKKEKKEGEDEAEGKKELTVDTLAEMTSEEFLEFSEEEIAAFMKEAGVPSQFTPAMVIQGVKAGQMTPERMATMIKSGGGGDDDEDEDEDSPEVKRRREVLAWLDEHVPGSVAPWTEVTLASGKKAEAGGVDPFAEIAPSMEILEPAIRVHTATVLELAGEIADLQIVSLEAEELGNGVYRVAAVAANRAELASHTKMAERARARLPVRLEIRLGDGAELVTGRRAKSSERLPGVTGTLEGEWLVRAKAGASVEVAVLSQAAGNDRLSITLGGSR